MSVTRTPASISGNPERKQILRTLSEDGSPIESIRFLERHLEEAIRAFRYERAVFDVRSEKAVIIGDLHGDTQAFKWITESYSPEDYTYILTGDYVDRGQSSTELLALLLANKLAYGKNFIMLRGDHESPIGKCSSQDFPEELATRFRDPIMARKIYDRLFPQLPIAVVLNGRFFIVHGGIPVNMLLKYYQPSIQELKRLRKVADPKDNNIMYQMLWNDPITDTWRKNPITDTWNDNGGVNDSPRGDGIYIFGKDIADSFLQQNGLEMIIRGHTHGLGGYRMIGKTLTLLTTNAYPQDRRYIAKLEDGQLDVYDIWSMGKPVLRALEDLRK